MCRINTQSFAARGEKREEMGRKKADTNGPKTLATRLGIDAHKADVYYIPTESHK